MPNENPSSTAHIIYRLNDIQPKVDKLHFDTYVGDAENPSITLRLDRQERKMAERDKKDDRTHDYIMRAFFLLIATFLTMIANVVLTAIKHTP